MQKAVHSGADNQALGRLKQEDFNEYEVNTGCVLTSFIKRTKTSKNVHECF